MKFEDPPLGFYFEVSFKGSSGGAEKLAFQEVSGISMERNTEEVQEGGLNRFTHHLPSQVKHSPLSLRRGIPTSAKSKFATWVQNTVNADLSQAIEPKTITVSLLDSRAKSDNENILMSWDFHNAYPTKWSVSDFKSQANDVVIESLEFRYQDFVKN
ncbi:MAG: phage tail protein [Bacteroidota bacterium]